MRIAPRVFLSARKNTRRTDIDRLEDRGVDAQTRRDMNGLTASDPARESLTRLLSSIARNPEQTTHLHGILGSYCHECRNILNGLKLSFYLAKRNGSGCGADAGLWHEVEPRYLEVERFIDRLHQLCRPVPVSPVKLSLNLLFEERNDHWKRALASAGRPLILEPPAEPVVGSFDPGRFASAFDDVVAWRARVGLPGTPLRISWCCTDGQFDVRWSEPRSEGVEARADLSSELTAPLDAVPAVSDDDRPGALDVLCIPLLTRIVALHGGTLDTNDDPRDGWQLRLRWPLDSRTPP
jgi:hypothetical protein